MERPAERTIWDVLNKLRYDYSEEIPIKMINGQSRERKFKVTRNWFTQVAGFARMMLDNGQVKSEGEIMQIENFVEKCRSTAFQRQPLTTPEDIRQGNIILDILLSKNPNQNE